MVIMIEKALTCRARCGVSVEKKTANLQLEWFEAAAAGDVEAVKRIAEEKVPVPKDRAIEVGEMEHAVKLDATNPDKLPKVGPKGEKIGSKGWTALLIAAENGHANVIEELLNRGADVNIDVSKGSSGTALGLAGEKYGENDTYKRCVELLVAVESTTIANLVLSGCAALPFTEAAADLIWAKAKEKGFSLDAPLENGITEFHTKRYSKWLKKQENLAAPES